MSTTMIIVTVLALVSLSALRNGLMDFKIAHAFDQQQLLRDRHHSALHYVESTIVPQIMNTDSALFQRLDTLEHAEHAEHATEHSTGLEIALPVRSLLVSENAEAAEQYLDPIVTVYRQGAEEYRDHGSESESDRRPTLRLRFEIRDNNTSHILTAIYAYQSTADSDPVFDSSNIQRLSLHRFAP